MDGVRTAPGGTPDGGDERLHGLPLLFSALGVGVLAAWVLALYAPLFKPERLHIQEVYVDQLGYVTTARILADTGELRNGILIPSQVHHPSFRPYMPGHFYALAASYVLFGWGVFQTLLPSLASYVLAAIGVFLIANRLYGRWSGVLAALVFALHPAEIAYAFTAMAELSFTLAAVVALLVFVHLPRRWQPFAPPVLLVLPFLFRESGAFLIVPMALVVQRRSGSLAAAVATAGSVVSLWLVNRWQIASGKLAASLAWVTEGGFNYQNAFPEPEPARTLGEWAAIVLANAGRNLGIVREHLAGWPGELMPAGLAVTAAVALVALAGGLLRRPRDPFALGAGLLMALVFALTVALYDTQAHKLMRTAMFTLPAGAVAVAGVARVETLVRRARGAGRAGRTLAALGALAAFALAVSASHAVAARAGA